MLITEQVKKRNLSNYFQDDRSIESEKYLFLDNNYDSDKSKRGVLQVSKEDGSIIFHPGKI